VGEVAVSRWAGGCTLKKQDKTREGSSWKCRARASTSSQMPPICMWETHCDLHQVVNNQNRKNREQERQEVRRDSTSRALPEPRNKRGTAGPGRCGFPPNKLVERFWFVQRTQSKTSPFDAHSSATQRGERGGCRVSLEAARTLGRCTSSPVLFLEMRSDWCFTRASMIDPLPLPSHVPILALITRLTSLALYCTHTTLVANHRCS
jgi:hypothetical protein